MGSSAQGRIGAGTLASKRERGQARAWEDAGTGICKQIGGGGACTREYAGACVKHPRGTSLGGVQYPRERSLVLSQLVLLYLF